MVLERNERQSQTGITSKPELERNVEDGALDGGSASHGGGELRDVANEVGIAELMTSRLGQLVPNVEPVTVVFITNNTLGFPKFNEVV